MSIILKEGNKGEQEAQKKKSKRRQNLKGERNLMYVNRLHCLDKNQTLPNRFQK